MRFVASLTGAAIVAVLAAESLVAASSADPVQSSAKAESDRLICRSMEETGSLARRRRQCFTRAEWDRIAEAARARGERLRGDMASGMISN